ncbi:restriction endonuclease subunit S [Fictibacillus sp. BK138]|uniref:restriction endonuclease subunit S n=1 Tax=Fictibacillus sp. BK138 TaxID=2512121 RepID=UPI001029D3C9|nr:restriction endonuclease subunit S [Fictibacillus sp. BK138]RZT23604.1 type I restriction enzyme S subunit [Fictibacillus sp. BK138]
MVKKLNVINEYKVSDIGSIPQDWKVIKLGEIFDFKNGLNKEKKYFGIGTPIVNYVDVFKKSSLTANDLKGRVKVSINELKAYEVRKDDVFFTRTSETVEEIGFSAVVVEELENTVFSGFILRARQRNSLLDTHFKKYCFSTEQVRKEIISKSTYTTRALTNGKILSQVLLPVPPIDEQRAISQSLNDIDSVIDSLEELIEKKRNIKQGAMHQLLEGKIRLPGFSEKWNELTIGDFSQVSAGGTPSTRKKEYWGGEIRWMNSGELNMKMIFDVEGRITEEGLKNSSTHVIPEKCVLIGLAGQGKTRGTIAINMVELCTNQSIAAIYPSNNHSSKYLYYNLDNRYKELRGLSTGDGGRGGLNLKIIKSLKIALPSLEEQIAIAKVLSDMDAEIQGLTQKLKKYQFIKQGMMNNLLTGKVRLVECQ